MISRFHGQRREAGYFLKIGLNRLKWAWYYILERRIEHENSNHAERRGSLDGRRAAHRVSNRRRASGMVEGKRLRKEPREKSRGLFFFHLPSKFSQWLDGPNFQIAANFCLERLHSHYHILPFLRGFAA